MIMRLFLSFLLMFATAAPPTAAASPPAKPAGVAIVGARVLTMGDAGVLEDQTVLVEGDRIVKVGPRAKVSVPAGYRTIDGKGRTLMPGLVDMHIHLAPAPGGPGDPAQRALAVMLAHGVTTARTMAGSPVHIGVRERIEAGEIAGPRLYAAAPAISVANTTSADQARAAVAAAKAAGFDLIKSHHIEDPAVWQALQEEARRAGMPTAGHVANEIGLDRALAAGQQVEHLDGVFMELLPAGSPERQIGFAQIPPPPVIEAAARATDAQIAAVARRVSGARGYMVPTLALFERTTAVDTPLETLMADPDMRYVPGQALEQWAQQRGQIAGMGFTPETAKRFVDLRRRIVRAFHAAGVPVMAGSDTAQSFHIWGPGLIREIQALESAGLSRMEALKAATVTPRDYFRSLPNGGSGLGWKADFGVVETGARADLILLNEDPSRDLAALKTLETVIAAGRVYDRAALDALLEKAAQDANPAGPAVATAPAHKVWVMRHLPPADGADPQLSAEGARMAAALPDFLQAAAIKAVFVTDTRRARETAAPLAAKLGLAPEVYDPANPAALVARVAAVNGEVLVVGHSNTTPDLVARFGGAPIAPLGHADFGSVWRIDAPGDTRRFRLGGVAPASLGACDVPGLSPRTRCGTVTVPEDRARPGGRQLKIRFAVLPSSGPVKDAPLVMLPGGPGLGGVASGPGTDQMFGAMLAGRDLLMIDQRGAGASNPLACAMPEDSGEALGSMAGSEAERVRTCRAELEKVADLRLYDTRQAVLDMDVVRQALGYPKLDMFGMSYGTRVALDYIRLYPDHVGETVIRAAAPVQMMLPFWTPRDAQHAFSRVVAACEAQADCAARHPDLAANLRAAVARLDKGPVKISVVDPRTGKREETDLDRNGFSSTLFFLLYVPEFYVHIPPLIEQAAAGNFSPMVQAMAPAMMGTGEQIAWGMRWSVICSEDVPRIDRRRLEAATRDTFMGPGSVISELDACALWPKGDVPADYFEPLRSDKPVLIISGEMDPVAGKVWGDEVARTLPNSLHVEAPGASHLPPLPGCTGELMARFIAGTPLSELDASCVADAPRPRLQVAGPAAGRGA